MSATTCAACGGRTAPADRFCARCGAALRGAPPRETRRKVTVLFLDLVGSTQLAQRLDPEPLREVMDGYFDLCAARVAEHGGAVEKFIGDAVVAAFGVGGAREDDAVRAVRAAAAALAGLRVLAAEYAARYQIVLEARCGVCTGDVVVLTTPGGDFRVIGDVGSTASRLQTAAPVGGILMDAETAALVRSRVAVEAVPPLRLKGKTDPVAAYRVVSPQAPDDTGGLTPFVGRAGELERLRRGLRDVARERRSRVITVLGAPGIGKTRLVREFLGGLPRDSVNVLSGRCSTYGRGITYEPLAQMLSAYPGGWPALARLLEPGGLADRILAAVVAGRAGPAGAQDTAGTADIAWALRSLLGALARDRPAVLVWEDLHVAEETLLDLIEDLAARRLGAPVLMVCVARGDLLEARPAWCLGKASATTLELAPLAREQITELVSRLADREEVYAHDYTGACDRVAAQCDGNPLFAELLMDVFAESCADERIPPTIHAVLGARLDRLPGAERALLELASIIGREFDGALLQELAAADGTAAPRVAELTAALVRRRVLLRGPAGTVGFAQSLLRETAYEFTAKARRIDGHDRLADRYAARGDARAVAYHVEASWRLRRDLRPGDPVLPRLASPAADTLTAEGMTALERKDLPAAVQLLERARGLVAAGDARHTALALHISDAGLWLWDAERCSAALDAARAAMPDDRRTAVLSAIQGAIVSVRLGRVPPGRVSADASAILADLEQDPEDDLSWCRFHYLRACLHLVAERASLADAELGLGLARARALADRHEEDRLLCARCELVQWTRTPVAAGLSLCTALADRFAAHRALLLPVLVTRINLLALAGDLDGARRGLAQAEAHSEETGRDLAAAAVSTAAGLVESLSGRHRRAEDCYRRALDILRAGEHAPDTRNVEVLIARELFEQARVDEAAQVLDRVEAAGAGSGPRARIAASALRGRIASARGRHGDAVRLATAARRASRATDDPLLAGEAAFDLAVVLRAAGRDADSASAAAAALRAFEDKGAQALAVRVRAALAAGRDPEAVSRADGAAGGR